MQHHVVTVLDSLTGGYACYGPGKLSANDSCRFDHRSSRFFVLLILLCFYVPQSVISLSSDDIIAIRAMRDDWPELGNKYPEWNGDPSTACSPAWPGITCDTSENIVKIHLRSVCDVNSGLCVPRTPIAPPVPPDTPAASPDPPVAPPVPSAPPVAPPVPSVPPVDPAPSVPPIAPPVPSVAPIAPSVPSAPPVDPAPYVTPIAPPVPSAPPVAPPVSEAPDTPATSPVSPPSPSFSCPSQTPPGPSFSCINGVWTSAGNVSEVTIQISSPTTIEGDLELSNTLTFVGIDGSLSVDGCVNIEGIEIVLSDEDVERIKKSSTGQQSLELLKQGKTTTGCGTLDSIPLSVKHPKSCTKVSVSRDTSSTHSSVAALFKVNSTNCHLWWIIFLSIIGGIIVIILVFVLLATFNTRVKEKMRPFWLPNTQMQGISRYADG